MPLSIHSLNGGTEGDIHPHREVYCPNIAFSPFFFAVYLRNSCRKQQPTQLYSLIFGFSLYISVINNVFRSFLRRASSFVRLVFNTGYVKNIQESVVISLYLCLVRAFGTDNVLAILGVLVRQPCPLVDFACTSLTCLAFYDTELLKDLVERRT